MTAKVAEKPASPAVLYQGMTSVTPICTLLFIIEETSALRGIRFPDGFSSL
jgi:hypothetical protein